MPDSPPVVPIALVAKDAEPLPEESRTDKSMPPTTTAAEDRTVAGQRRVSLMWEATQGIIAVSVVAALIYVEIAGRTSSVLTTIASLIVGNYYARTNHAAIGGIGRKATDSQAYLGR